jgi:MFS family permease
MTQFTHHKPPAQYPEGSGTPSVCRRSGLPRAAGFWLVAGVLFLLFFEAAAPSPLYGVYQAQWRFSAATLTAVFAAYALALLVTLLVFGSVSGYLGRRRVILAGLAEARQHRLVGRATSTPLADQHTNSA